MKISIVGAGNAGCFTALHYSYYLQNDGIENAEIEFEPQQLFDLESFDKCEGMGRIAVMDSNQLVMLGKVMSVEYKPFKK